MKYFEKHRNVLKCIRSCAAFLAIWPINPKAGKVKRIFYSSLWWCYMVFVVLTLPALVAGVFYSYGDLINFMKALTETTYWLEVTFNLFWSRIYKRQLRVLIDEIEEFEKTATQRERMLRRKFLKRTKLIYPSMLLIFVTGALFFVFSPAVVPGRIVPLNAVYPFPVKEKSWARYFVYAMNNLAILMAASTIIVDLMILMLIWFGSHKFATLDVSFKAVVDYEQLRLCVLKHQEVLRYAKGIENSVNLVIFKSTIAASISMIACSLFALSNVPLFELTQFLMVTFFSMFRLLMVSWSAGIMTEVAYNITWSVYDSQLISSSSRMRKAMLIIIHRCQIPVTISIEGIITETSLRICGMVLYRVFSFFMAFRTILRV